MTVVEIRDWQIRAPEGMLFARTWMNRRGPRTPILLFHDSLGSVELWRNFPEKLSASTGHTVIAYDRLGFGQSDPYPGRLPMNFVRTEAHHFVPLVREQLRISSFIACGHSVGGGMAVEAAAHFSNDCTGLVTIGAQALVDDRILDGIRVAKAEFAKSDNLARLARYHRDPRWVVGAWVETWLDPAFASFSLDEALEQVKCPVLAVHGEDDQYGSTEHAARIAAGRGRTVILNGVGHVPHRESEDALVDQLKAFVTGKLVQTIAGIG